MSGLNAVTSKPGLRKDALRNIGQLLNAAGALLRSDPAEASMQAIADRANVSLATAYRYFPTLQSLHTAFLQSVIVNMRDYSMSSQLAGKALFHDVCSKWVEILDVYGQAMIQIRSRRGLLERLDADDPITSGVLEVWDRPIREMLRESGISEHYFRHALFLFNMIFDPREIEDLRTTEGIPSDHIVALLTEAFYGALHGWVTAATKQDHHLGKARLARTSRPQDAVVPNAGV